MQFGYFDDENKEYVLTRPDTPRPWSNYLGSSQFGGVITNNAAGYTFYRSAAQGRLSRFRFNGIPASYPGRFIYLQDEDGDFWTNSWMPVGKSLDEFKYECRHGTGYTKIKSEYREIESQAVYFSPLNQLYEIWKLKVSNKGDKKRKIKLTFFLEPQCNWNAEDDNTNLQYTQYISTTKYIDGMIDIGSNVNMPEDPEHFENKDQKRHTFFALCGAEIKSFDADLDSFLGTYGSYASPAALQQGKCSGSTAAGDMPCAALQVEVELTAGESKDLAVIFGIGQAADKGKELRQRYSDFNLINTELQKVKDFWYSRLKVLFAQTPDKNFNSMLNLWAPYNNLMTFYWSRTASLVYAGERDGLGYRDSLQDITGASTLVTEEALDMLKLLITGQYSSGGAKPVVKPFNHQPGKEVPPDHYRADDCMWLFNAVPAYVKETGNFDFYKEVLPYADKGEATVFGHLRRAIEFNLERSGAHKLPCGLHADWNDCIRLGEKGETVFVAFQLRYGLREYIDIAGRLGEEGEKTWAEKQLAELDAALEKNAWDGEWYLRAFRYDGLKFGSKDIEEGRIFMNPQSWAVLSGHATGERAAQVMESMHKHLATEYGIMVCTPPYVNTDPQIALGRLMIPGSKENGGIFNHTQGWAVMAACELGMGDRAWEYMRNVMPASFNDKAEIRQVEPYVVCQSTHSSFSPRYGSGRCPWLSGSAVWNYYAMMSAILGIKPEYEGLAIDPCLPTEWDGYTAQRIFRGCRFDIKVKKGQKAKGVRQITINGKTIKDKLIPQELFQKENTVLVEME